MSAACLRSSGSAAANGGSSRPRPRSASKGRATRGSRAAVATPRGRRVARRATRRSTPRRRPTTGAMMRTSRAPGRRSPARSPPTCRRWVSRRLPEGSGERRDVVDTFVPGMVLTIDRNRQPGRPSDLVFRRLYAPRRAAHDEARGPFVRIVPQRSGRARLWRRRRFDTSARRPAAGGRSTAASAALAADGLPADAWIPFLGAQSRNALDARGCPAVHRRRAAEDPAASAPASPAMPPPHRS